MSIFLIAQDHLRQKWLVMHSELYVAVKKVGRTDHEYFKDWIYTHITHFPMFLFLGRENVQGGPYCPFNECPRREGLAV